MPADHAQVQALTQFFIRDTDASRFNGLAADATLDDVKQRFGTDEYVSSGTTIMGRREVPVTIFKRSEEVEVAGAKYTWFCEVFVFEPGVAFPYVDLRLVRAGYSPELKAAASELKEFFSELHGRSMTFERGGVKGEVWVEANGSKAAAATSLRVRVSPKR